MATMVSLGRSTAELQDKARPMTDPLPASQVPQYPGGAVLYLTAEELKKLGLNDGTLESGDTCQGTWQGIVTATGMDTGADGSKQFRASIQITDMSLEPTSDIDDRAETMYGSGKGGSGEG